MTKIEKLLEIYTSVVTIRKIEEIEENYVKQGKAFFHMPSKGHEGTVVINNSLIKEDYLACHYRDKALMVARGAKPLDFFYTMLCKEESDSSGRQMSAFLHNRDLNILSLSGPVTNAALHSCGIAEELKRQDNYTEKTPIVYCGLGDGMTQEGEFYEAVLYAMQKRLPILFVVQDNGYAISTKTKGKTFFSTAHGDEDSFCGVPIERLNGFDIEQSEEKFSKIIARIRTTATQIDGIVPALVVLKTERLSSHTNADDQTIYRTKEELEYNAKNFDPLMILENKLLELGVVKSELENIEKETNKRIQEDLEKASNGTEPKAEFSAKQSADWNKIQNKAILLNEKTQRQYSDKKELTMNEAINAVLFNRLANDNNITLFGEDIEDPKGDVFGVTKSLSTVFPNQVINAPLAEAAITGISVGKALVGGKPVGFFQFADFMAPAMNQLFSEVGNMYWRTNGKWQNPCIFMVSCGAYRPGLGPFHASTMEQMILQIPGIDVFMPSNATDAAKLLNTAFESNRPTVFFYPKNCLNIRTLSTPFSSITQCAKPTQAKIIKKGSDITLVGWGNTTALLESASTIIEETGKSTEIIDLASLSPWDLDTVVESTKRTGKILVVQENNITCSFASEVTASVTEWFSKNEKNQPTVRRLSRSDTYVPFHYGNQVEILPSVKTIVETIVEIIGGVITWEEENKLTSNNTLIKATGTSPSDEIITVVEWLVKTGDTIKEGDIIANMEADKASFEFASPVSGKIAEIIVAEGDSVDVGKNLFSIEGTADTKKSKTVTREEVKKALITWEKERTTIIPKAPQVHINQNSEIGIAGIEYTTGSRKISTQTLEELHEWTGVAKKNGIQERFWVGKNENAVTLGFDAASKLLDRLHLSIMDIDSVICATGSPVNISPSNACLILNKLSTKEGVISRASAFDFSSACSGYIYGLQITHDFIFAKPDSKILFITAETLTPQVNQEDLGTAPIFSDAATASIICTSNTMNLEAIIKRPQTSSFAEDGNTLRIPRDINEPIFMDGPAVFLAAVKEMSESLKLTCVENNITPDDIDIVVPHQANQRIINSVRQKLKLKEDKIYSNIAHFGNTSSCSIPIALSEVFKTEAKGNIAICSFGAGFTVGSCLLQR